jgi:hypothetical protein
MRIRPGHVPNQMDNRIAGADIEIEFIECDDAVILEILLHLDLNVVAREIAPKLIAIITEFVCDGRKEDLDGHNFDSDDVLSSVARRLCVAEAATHRLTSRLLPLLHQIAAVQHFPFTLYNRIKSLQVTSSPGLRRPSDRILLELGITLSHYSMCFSHIP